MKPYTVRLVFRILHGEDTHSGVFEEQIRLLFAESKEEADEKARAIGVAENFTLPQIETGFVKWEFVGILELNQVDDLSDGMLLTSISRETSDPKGFLKYLSHCESLQNEASEPVG